MAYQLQVDNKPAAPERDSLGGAVLDACEKNYAVRFKNDKAQPISSHARIVKLDNPR